MNNKEIRDLFRKNRPMLVIIMLSVIVLVGSSYAWYNVSYNSEDTNTVTAGNLDLVLQNESGVITLTNTVPQSDSSGLNSSAYSFTVKNSGSISNKYTVYLDDETVSGNRISDSNIRYSLEKNSYSTGAIGLNTLNGVSGKRKLAEGVLQAGETATYKLRVWIAESATTEIEGQQFKAKIRIEGEQIKHIANEPELRGDMIPVTWDATTSKWQKADYTKNVWYNYDNQEWANAVTIKDTTKRTTYKNASIGTEVKVEDMNLMLVWIPRYSYTLRDQYGYKIDGASELSQATPGAFDIRFVDTSTTEMGTGKYTGTTPTEYYTPSSFCWGNSCDDETTRSNEGNKELPGIWISKFELTGTITDISSLPNKPNLKSQNNSQFFNAIKNLANNGTGTTNYGFAGTNYDTHMIKNTEWGAMAYLSQSKYGKYGNKSYSNTNKEIYINDYNQSTTGCSKGAPGTGESKSDNVSTTCKYQYSQSPEGTGASTTGTIYGIYDTSGLSYERVMGIYETQLAQSGFTSEAMPEAKYYNKYTGTTGIKGDATNADGTSGFYGDFKTFVSSSIPWVGRGGDYYSGIVGGIFGYAGSNGNGSTFNDTRLVISMWQ